MKSLITLFRLVLADASTRCRTSTTRDLKTIMSRVEEEGISFLTISLANFGRDFEKSLDQGYVDRNLFTGFRFRAGLPQLFGGFLDLIFDRKSGRLLDSPSIEAIRCIRQLTLMNAKVRLACTPKRNRAAIDSYIETERNIRHHDQTLNEVTETGETRLADFARIGRLLWADLFTKVDLQIYRGEIIPKHSSGATADGIFGNQKYRLATWTQRMDSVFPDWENLIPSPRFTEDLQRVIHSDPGTELPCKVILVPKTLKTPRVIAMEPCAVQYMQQGILEALTRQVECDDNAFNFVRSVSQEPNQELAREGSIKGTLATLDLSEASDRVSNQHVRALLHNHRHLFDGVDATRSRKADVPGYGVQRLAKFASMGSALCFPFEAMVFTTVVFLGIEKVLNRRLTKKDIKSFYGLVRVYGDDIIVPVDYVHSVVRELENFGFRVNRNKSFWNGKFRESCGKDYYDGHDVSIVRVRELLPLTKRNVPELISAVSLRNQLFHAGYFGAVEYLDRKISAMIPFPEVAETSSVLGRHTYGPLQVDKHDSKLHRPLVRGYVVVAAPPPNEIDGSAALLKFFLKRGFDPNPDGKHLERSGRPRTVSIKFGWSPV